MIEVASEINPLQISFSNDKGFEPSTPSQDSPSLSDKQSILRVRTPREVFDPEQTKELKRKVYVPKVFISAKSKRPQKMYQSLTKNDFKLDTTTSYAKMYETRYSSTHKRQWSGIPFVQSPRLYKSTLYESDLLRQKKRAKILNWDKIDPSNHLKEISRLNNLINKVTTHMNAFNRVHPLKRK